VHPRTDTFGYVHMRIQHPVPSSAAATSEFPFTQVSSSITSISAGQQGSRVSTSLYHNTLLALMLSKNRTLSSIASFCHTSRERCCCLRHSPSSVGPYHGLLYVLLCQLHTRPRMSLLADTRSKTCPVAFSYHYQALVRIIPHSTPTNRLADQEYCQWQVSRRLEEHPAAFLL